MWKNTPQRAVSAHYGANFVRFRTKAVRQWATLHYALFIVEFLRARVDVYAFQF